MIDSRSSHHARCFTSPLPIDPQLPIVDRGEDKTHEMAAVLKQFIREIPGRLIPRANIAQVLANREDVDKLQDAMDGMDDANYYTLRYLVLFLRAVAANGARNKMATPTVAMVFAPTVFSDVEASVNILGMRYCSSLGSRVKS